MLDVLNQIGSLFNALVVLITSCFSFLPDWCLVFMGSALVFTVAILIFKMVV